MNPATVPVPANPRHRVFVLRLWHGESGTVAYLSAGYRSTRAAARSSASRLRRRTDVAACISALQSLAHFEILPGHVPGLSDLKL